MVRSHNHVNRLVIDSAVDGLAVHRQGIRTVQRSGLIQRVVGVADRARRHGAALSGNHAGAAAAAGTAAHGEEQGLADLDGREVDVVVQRGDLVGIGRIADAIAPAERVDRIAGDDLMGDDLGVGAGGRSGHARDGELLADGQAGRIGDAVEILHGRAVGAIVIADVIEGVAGLHDVVDQIILNGVASQGGARGDRRAGADHRTGRGGGRRRVQGRGGAGRGKRQHAADLEVVVVGDVVHRGDPVIVLVEVDAERLADLQNGVAVLQRILDGGGAAGIGRGGGRGRVDNRAGGRSGRRSGRGCRGGDILQHLALFRQNQRLTHGEDVGILQHRIDPGLPVVRVRCHRQARKETRHNAQAEQQAKQTFFHSDILPTGFPKPNNVYDQLCYRYVIGYKWLHSGNRVIALYDMLPDIARGKRKNF